MRPDTWTISNCISWAQSYLQLLKSKAVSKEEDKGGMQSLSLSSDKLQNSGPDQGEDVLPKGQ